MVRAIALLVAGFAGAAVAREPAAITDEAAFRQAIAAVRADAKNYDKFKESVDTGLIGKPFAISMPVQQEIEGQGVAFYDYKDGKLILDVSPQNAWPLLAGPKEKLPTLILSDSTKMTGKYIGQNAFGATAEVRDFRNSGAGIAIVDSPKPMLSPMRAAMNAKLLEDTDWWVALDLPPTEAKALALNAVAVVQGTYAKLPSGSVGFCSTGSVSATISSPSNYSSEKCFIGAQVSRIALIDKRTNAVLKEWTTASNPILGPELWGGVRAGMNRHQLKQAQLNITDYGYLAANGQSAQVEMEKDVASKVRVRLDGFSGRPLMDMLTRQYGQPLASKCISTLCEGRWRVNSQVDAYLSITGEVTYQLSSDEPPIGFSP